MSSPYGQRERPIDSKASQAEVDRLRRSEQVDDHDLGLHHTDIERLLDDLQQSGYLSDERFIDTRIHAREEAWGHRRISHELKQHGLVMDDARLEGLRRSEAARARHLWLRRFGQPPRNLAERAKQMRFLAGRGFSGDAIRSALGDGMSDAGPPTDFGCPIDVD